MSLIIRDYIISDDCKFYHEKNTVLFKEDILEKSMIHTEIKKDDFFWTTTKKDFLVLNEAWYEWNYIENNVSIDFLNNNNIKFIKLLWKLDNYDVNSSGKTIRKLLLADITYENNHEDIILHTFNMFHLKNSYDKLNKFLEIINFDINKVLEYNPNFINELELIEMYNKENNIFTLEWLIILWYDYNTLKIIDERLLTIQKKESEDIIKLGDASNGWYKILD